MEHNPTIKPYNKVIAISLAIIVICTVFLCRGTILSIESIEYRAVTMLIVFLIAIYLLNISWNLFEGRKRKDGGLFSSIEILLGCVVLGLTSTFFGIIGLLQNDWWQAINIFGLPVFIILGWRTVVNRRESKKT